MTKGAAVRIGETASGRADIGGVVDVSGEGVGRRGGLAEVFAAEVNVDGIIDARGTSGGGSIYLGGGEGGRGERPRATTTIVSPDAQLLADAALDGNGGRIVLWGDVLTSFRGTASARGGPLGGDGGFVETTGGRVDYRGTLAAHAPAGRGGEWVLDPGNIKIVAAGASLDANGNFTGVEGETLVAIDDVKAALKAGTSVTIATLVDPADPNTGSVLLEAPLVVDATEGPATLSLLANRNVGIKADIVVSNSTSDSRVDFLFEAGRSGVELQTDADGNVVGDLRSNANVEIGNFDGRIVSIDTDGGDLTVRTASFANYFENNDPDAVPGGSLDQIGNNEGNFGNRFNYFGRVFFNTPIRTQGGDFTLETLAPKPLEGLSSSSATLIRAAATLP